ncbi:glycoside hydrolase family 19 protein [Pseudomonas sp. S2_D06]
MASVLSRLFGLHKYDVTSRSDAPQVPNSSVPDTHPLPTSPAAEPTPHTLRPLESWCHPFQDKSDSLRQLTHLANAVAGYYPLGRGGLWHGGVHFDKGTAGTLKQFSVHCLADGEVVAYRIDTDSPKTAYFANDRTVEKPFSRNFVLVRHHLQPPKIEGSQDTPPSLTFYSLYMHLQDWAKYQLDSTLARPRFWPERPTFRVKQTANDVFPGRPEQLGLKVYNKSNGQLIDFLPRGAEVAISGTGQFRRLESSLGPAKLLNPDGSIKGYLSIQVLKHSDRKETRISSSKQTVNVRAEPVIADNVIFDLPLESEVTVSGEGEFRKLERINQYVQFDSLEGAIEPVATDQVVVLDQPVALKAGDLIGHLGLYQDGGANQPDEKLHLETFSGDDVEAFIEASREWATRLPEKERIWLKLPMSTPVVPSEGHITAALLQASSDSSPRSAADLLIPKKLLDELPTDRKIQVPATPTRKARTWYRLEHLLHDADNNLLDGWVCEEPGVTPWVSPWAWEGYDIIIDYSRPKHLLASFLSAIGRLSDEERERYRAIAEKDDKGPMKRRLYEIIGRNPDGTLTATELKAALERPAHAQSISQMILYKESEWFQQPKIWDALDELLGHSGSTPHLNWLAEKQRIAQMGWWREVAEKVELPSWGSAYHFHPIGLVGLFLEKREVITMEMLRAADPHGASNYHQEILPYLNMYASTYKIDTPLRIAHFLAQVGHESKFKVKSENGNFSPKRMREIFGCKGGQKNYNTEKDDCDFGRLRTKLWSHENTYANNAVNLLSYVYADRMGNRREETQDGYKYRGRGIIQLTGRFNYERYTRIHNAANPSDLRDFVENPDLIIDELQYGVESAFVYCSMTNFNLAADEDDIKKTTLIINGGHNGLHERKENLNSIKKLMGI